MVLLFYTTYISVDLAHQVIFHAKVGKGGFSLLYCYHFMFEILNAMYVVQYIYVLGDELNKLLLSF